MKMVSFLTLGAAFKHLVRMPREHRLLGHCFGTRIKGRRGFLRLLFPPPRHQPPAHRHQFTLALAFNDCVKCYGALANCARELPEHSNEFGGLSKRVMNFPESLENEGCSVYQCLDCQFVEWFSQGPMNGAF